MKGLVNATLPVSVRTLQGQKQNAGAVKTILLQHLQPKFLGCANGWVGTHAVADPTAEAIKHIAHVVVIGIGAKKLRDIETLHVLI